MPVCRQKPLLDTFPPPFRKRTTLSQNKGLWRREGGRKPLSLNDRSILRGRQVKLTTLPVHFPQIWHVRYPGRSTTSALKSPYHPAWLHAGTAQERGTAADCQGVILPKMTQGPGVSRIGGLTNFDWGPPKPQSLRDLTLPQTSDCIRQCNQEVLG